MLRWNRTLKSLPILAIILLTCGWNLMAQPYGNEWIDHNQTYYKFKIAENGLFRITREQLSAAGFPVASVPASRIQLFRDGQEIAIDLSTQGDGTLEELMFYGQRNDGSKDAELYVSADAHVNPKYNLFADSASYFLTYYLSSQIGNRMDAYSEANSDGLPAAPYHLQVTDTTFSTDYGRGRKYGSQNSIESSLYDYGEGWTGNFFTRGNVRTIELSASGTYSDGPNPILKMQLVGGNNNGHNIQITVGPTEGSQRLIRNASFTGFDNLLVEETLEWTDLGADGALVIQVTPLGVGGAADRISVAFTEVTFAQELDINSQASMSINLPAGDDKTFIRVHNPPTDVTLLDITDVTNPILVGVNQSSDNFIGIIRNTSSTRNLLATNEVNEIGAIHEITFESIDPAAYNFLIISHASLREGSDPVADYSTYRSSAAGGGYQVHTANIDDLFDQFNYGDPSPLAIRRYADFMLDGGEKEHLLIIGKGTTVNYDFYRQDPTNLSYVHYVPTYGLPGSDVPLTSGLNGTDYEAAIPTGRINALNQTQVTNYLDKVIEMESTPYDELWRKSTLHLSGGKNASEQSAFKGYIDNYGEIVEGDFLGGTNKSISKKTTDETELITIAGEINSGLSFITFFGHSSSSASDIEIGNVTNPIYGYQNEGRYPVFLINGCNAGSVFNASDFVGWGDDWILAEDLGAIGFIASVDRAFSTNLRNFSDLFYQHAFQDDENFGMSLGEIMKLTSRDYIDFHGASSTNIAQAHQFILNGDPAVKIFGATQPDFSISANEITFSSESDDLILTTTESFYIDIPVKNLGRSVSDSVNLTVFRILGDGTEVSYNSKNYPRILNEDTLRFEIQANPLLNEGGTNTFTITLDIENLISELDENNNEVVVELDIFTGSTSNLHPLDFGIVGNKSVPLLFQTSNLLSGERGIIVEFDTVPDFSSNFRNQSIVTANPMGELTADIDFPGISDGAVFYWRTKLENPIDGESDSWVTSSFTYIENSPSGWMQSSQYQLEQLQQLGITLQADKSWEFEAVSTSLNVSTHGADQPLGVEDVTAIVNEVNFTATVSGPPCNYNSLNAMVFDRKSTVPYKAYPFEGRDISNRFICGRTPQVVFNFLERDVTGVDTTNQSSVHRIFLDLIDTTKTGDRVLLFNMGTVNFSNWDNEVISRLNDIGVSTNDVENLTDGQPVIILGRKGATQGTATVISNNGSGDPLLEQMLNLDTQINGSDGEGEIKSLSIGPASRWIDFQQSVTNTDSNDNYGATIYGLNGSESINLEEGITDQLIDLSAYSTNDYPYLQLTLDVLDPVEQTPANLDNWKVLFEEVADGILLQNTEPVTVQEGQMVSMDFGFYNYTTQAFSDDLDVRFSITNQTTRETVDELLTLEAVEAGDTAFFTVNISTFGFEGVNDFELTVNVNGVPELYLSNNSLRVANLLTVEDDEVNPVLDVTINGKHIKNGEIISPNPVIEGILRDDNPFFLKKDTVGILVFYKPPFDSLDFERVYFSDPALNWQPATATSDFKLTYSPTDLADGWHGIRIQAQDASGNQVGVPYEMNFTVLSTRSIYDVQAFPNPFSEGVRFAFTITGRVAPDDMILRIFNIHGKQVQEIPMSERNEITVGQNVTQSIWDGRDVHGLPVSNGVYFYRITFLSKENRKSFGNFENSRGRLILMR